LSRLFVPALALIVAGIADLVSAVSLDAMELRLGLLMTVLGGWLLRRVRETRERVSRPNPVTLLLATLLIAIGSIGLMVRAGVRSWMELGLELSMLTLGVYLIAWDNRRERSASA
jgi:hypothetical protein